jgi:hypothetical protein
MITNPQNIFEQVQNDIASALLAVAPFKDLKLPDGSDFDVLTEDEGDPEMLFTEFIAKSGLCVIAQSPTGKIATNEQMGTTQFNPLVIPVSISEAIIFNRSDQGTKVRLMVAVKAVLKTLHAYSVPCLKQKIYATRMLKDRDTQPETGNLVASRIITFEANEVFVDLT